MARFTSLSFGVEAMLESGVLKVKVYFSGAAAGCRYMYCLETMVPTVWGGSTHNTYIFPAPLSSSSFL
jgi:hypothetical protein